MVVAGILGGRGRSSKGSLTRDRIDPPHFRVLPQLFQYQRAPSSNSDATALDEAA